MATTTNYSWSTPDDTALVKDGAAAIRSLGTAIDTTTYNNSLLPIVKTIVDAKGDIIAATAADTVARLAVGTNGQVLTADSTAATGLAYTTISSGGMTSIASGSLSGTATTLSSIPATYVNLFLILSNVQCNSSASQIRLQINGSTSGYRYNKSPCSTVTITNESAVGGWRITDEFPQTSANSDQYTAEFKGYASTSYKSCFATYTSDRFNAGGFMSGVNGSSNAAISSVTITTVAGTATFTGGTYVLYGVK